MGSHDDFNPERLTKLKNHHNGYRFCPRCGIEMIETEADGRLRMVCPSPDCGFIFYHNPVPAAGAIIVEDGKILLVKRAHPPCIGWWCIPAGYMEWDESPAQCAVRELLEETALTVELDELFEVYSGNDDPRTNAVLVLYTAHIVSGTPTPADDALEVDWFDLDELPDKIAFQAHRQALKDYRTRHIDGKQ